MEKVFHYRNHIQDISRISDDLGALAKEWAIPVSELRQVTVIVEELISNIIRFAFQDADPHLIRVMVGKEDRLLIIRITDDGIPFNPMEYHPPPITDPASVEAGGMGIVLVRTFSDSIDYKRIDHENRLTVIKTIKSKH
ncbi:MAG TPA: ATP-binding protein [Bacteroides sp.]|nr:ATP-binding protein [Bacteroides sp.]